VAGGGRRDATGRAMMYSASRRPDLPKAGRFSGASTNWIICGGGSDGAGKPLNFPSAGYHIRVLLVSSADKLEMKARYGTTRSRCQVERGMALRSLL
jgi:hypothetical protein